MIRYQEKIKKDEHTQYGTETVSDSIVHISTSTAIYETIGYISIIGIKSQGMTNEQLVDLTLWSEKFQLA